MKKTITSSGREPRKTNPVVERISTTLKLMRRMMKKPKTSGLMTMSSKIMMTWT